MSDSSYSTLIAEVRRAIGDDGERQALIRTRRGKGYRFVAPVTLVSTRASRHQAGKVYDAPAERPGRDLEPGAETVVRSLEAAQTAGPRHLQIAGPAACGVAETCVAIAADRGWRVVRGRRSDSAAPPLWPWWQVSTALCEPDEASPSGDIESWQRITREVAAFARHDSEPGQLHDVAFRQRRFALFDGIARALRRAARRRPLALCLEGIDEADPDTIRLVEFGLRAAECTPLWLVTTGSKPPDGRARLPPRTDLLVWHARDTRVDRA